MAAYNAYAKFTQSNFKSIEDYSNEINSIYSGMVANNDPAKQMFVIELGRNLSSIDL